jgi:hypothetical protein
VGLARALLRRRRPADDRLDADQRRALLLAHRGVDRDLERVQVVDVVDGLHVPAVGLEALADVLGLEAQLRRAVERDGVVVVEIDEAPEPEVTRERGRLGGDSLHHVAVGADREHAVAHHVGAELLAQEALGHRHADAVGEPLTQRPGRHLDALGLVHAVALGMAGRERAPLPEALDLVERQRVAGQVQGAVEEHRPVARAEDEAVAVGPARVPGVVLHDPRVEQVGGGRHRHRQAGMAGARRLDGVHRQRADRVDAERVDVLRHGRVVSLPVDG